MRRHRPGPRGLRALSAVLLLLLAPRALAAQREGPPGAAFTEGAAPAALAEVMLHPLVGAPFTCTQHAFHPGDPVILGDAVGADCTVIRYDDARRGRRPPAFFENDGARNEDWFGWGEPLLAPFDGTVEEVHVNGVENVPGTPGRGPASYIVFRRADGVRAVYGHVREIRVQEGEAVRAGQPVASVGNDGFGYMPHTHVGAWRGSEPLQLRWDPVRLGVLLRGEARAAK